jgi:hypothetical protein
LVAQDLHIDCAEASRIAVIRLAVELDSSSFSELIEVQRQQRSPVELDFILLAVLQNEAVAPADQKAADVSECHFLQMIAAIRGTRGALQNRDRWDVDASRSVQIKSSTLASSVLVLDRQFRQVPLAAERVLQVPASAKLPPGLEVGNVNADEQAGLREGVALDPEAVDHRGAVRVKLLVEAEEAGGRRLCLLEDGHHSSLQLLEISGLWLPNDQHDEFKQLRNRAAHASTFSTSDLVRLRQMALEIVLPRVGLRGGT